uniref:DUF642 domain-containing protein n=3 Tax=Setaria italica TaxID=4555 RepID=K3XGN4_SETIT
MSSQLVLAIEAHASLWVKNRDGTSRSMRPRPRRPRRTDPPISRVRVLGPVTACRSCWLISLLSASELGSLVSSYSFSSDKQGAHELRRTYTWRHVPNPKTGQAVVVDGILADVPDRRGSCPAKQGRGSPCEQKRSTPAAGGRRRGMMRRVALLLLVCAAARAAAVVTDGLLPNGNFEEGPPKSALVNGTVVRGANAIPLWETSGFVEYIESGHKQGDMLLVVPQGAHAVRLGNEASIRQRLAVTRGAYYAITFSAARTCAQAERLNVSVSPEWGVLPMQTIYGSNGWDSYAWAFKAKFDTVTLVIHNPGVEEDPACGPLIDGVAIRALYPPTLVRGNMLKNGGFEEGPYFLPNASWGVLVPPNIEDDHSPLPAWMIVSSKAVKYVDAAHFKVPQGARAVELVGGRESALVQEVRTVPGWSYRLSFAVGDAGDGCTGSMVAEAFAARATVKVPYESKGTGGYKRAVLDFTAIANRTRVVFQSTFYHMKADGTLCGPLVDDASLVGLRKKPAAGRRLLL